MTYQPPNSFISRFYFAFRGIGFAFRYQLSMRIHLFAALLAIGCGLYFRLHPIEWLFMFIAITLVVCTEMINTAIEEAVNAATTDWNRHAMIAKDIAAGAVAVSVLFALGVGYLLFYDRFVTLMLN